MALSCLPGGMQNRASRAAGAASAVPDGMHRHIVMDSRVLIRQVKLADELQACLQIGGALQGEVSQQL